MATYKGIQGYTVQTLSSDPSPAANVEGQLWYNSTSGTYKIAVGAAGAWASGADTNSNHRQMGLTGIQTAAIAVAGTNAFIQLCETYDGSTWTEVADLTLGREYNVAFGTTTAAVCTGGVYDPGPGPILIDQTETFNGSAWTEVADLNTARMKMSTANQGTTTAGLIFGGMYVPSTGLDFCESWDGTSWTEEADINTARSAGGGGGTSTAAFLVTGNIPPQTTACETWDGTSWTATNSNNTGREGLGSSGTTTSALIYAGTPPNTAITEKWDGTSWTEVGDLGSARQGVGKGTGLSGGSALCVGFDGSPMKITEEWNDPVYSIKTVTVS